MSRIRRNIAWLLLSQSATWVVSIATMVIVPPILGADRFGELSFAIAYVAMFELIAIFGTGSFLTMSVARSPGDRGLLVFNALVLKFVMSMVVAGLAALLGLVLGFSDQRMTLILIFSASMTLAAMSNAVIAGLHGTQDMGRPAQWDIVARYLGTALAVAVLLAGGGLTAYAAAGAWVGFVPLLANSLTMRDEIAADRRVDLEVWRRITIGGAPFFALAALNLLQGAIDVPMLEALAGTEDVGWYTLAVRWASMPTLVAVVAATAFFPALSAEGATVNRNFVRMVNRCLHLVILIAVPASVGIALIADRFIALLYGNDFTEAVPIMRLLSIEIPFASIDVVLGVAIMAAGRQRQWVIVAGIAAVFNPVANVFAVPWADDHLGNAGVGAAFTTVLTELIMFSGALRLSPSGVLDNQLRRVAVRVAIASAAMVPVVLVLHALPLALVVAAGTVVYAAASVLLRTVSSDDLRELRAQLARRRGSSPEDATGDPTPLP